jgi:hypothetical protein
MLAPLAQVPIKGFLWYQGEADTDSPSRYYKMLRKMISDWRDLFNNQRMPILLVQLPKYAGNPPNTGDSWAKFRECQEQLWKNTPNTGLAVAIDTGLETDINPKEKRPIAQRLAKYALGSVYNRNIVYKPPIYKTITISGNKLILEFDNVGTGLITSNGGSAVVGFEISADGTNFVPATAKILDANKIEVTAIGINTPKEARYAWENYYLQENIRNSGNLPIGSFRTNFNETYISDYIVGGRNLTPLQNVQYPTNYISNVSVAYENGKMRLNGVTNSVVSNLISLLVKAENEVIHFDTKKVDNNGNFEFIYPFNLSEAMTQNKEITISIDNLEISKVYLSNIGYVKGLIVNKCEYSNNNVTVNIEKTNEFINDFIMVLVSVYDQAGKLKNIKNQKLNFVSYKAGLNLDVSDITDGADRIKIFIWNDLNNLKPLFSVKSFNWNE